uniref:Uncharacterized protein n=1 Tax=Timema poppense TaxID=170557 RepID=A0A7R9CX84_TIMPO|nr:unnamed protein product [Timema poppensis]
MPIRQWEVSCCQRKPYSSGKSKGGGTHSTGLQTIHTLQERLIKEERRLSKDDAINNRLAAMTTKEKKKAANLCGAGLRHLAVHTVDEGVKSQDMWTPFKELQSVVDAVLANPAPGALTQLKQVLRKHKQNFITLLKNPPKNAESREKLRKGISECIHLPGMGYQILSKELVDEALIISDMYDLNEILAIDLLCTAQQQLQFHPGLNRGLVAILLYYDGRKALVSALRSLVHVRKDLLECLDLSKELELLQHNRALGGPKHQHQVVEQFQEIRQALADIIFLWTAQTGLPKDPTFKLINHLKSCKIQDEVSGGIDGVNLALEMALLCALDLSLLHRMEDGAELVRNLPLLSDTLFIPALVRELSQCVKPWECLGLQATTQLAWALALTTLRLSPNNLYTDRSVLEEDEIVVETAIDLKVFDFLHTVFLENKTIYKQQFYLQRLHTLITDFLVLMPTKVKELRTRGDETARTVQVYAHEGLEPPASLTHHFEHLLLTVERFYRDNPLGLELALDFWCPTDTTKHSTIYLYGIPSKQSFPVLFGFAALPALALEQRLPFQRKTLLEAMWTSGSHDSRSAPHKPQAGRLYD